MKKLNKPTMTLAQTEKFALNVLYMWPLSMPKFMFFNEWSECHI